MGISNKGITLIELIIFIIVGAIFIPLAYIAFTSVVNNSMKPETAARMRSIAEAKMIDISSLTYDNVTPVSTSYQDVSTDPLARFTDTSYVGFQWGWEITYAAYIFVKNGVGFVTNIYTTGLPGGRIENTTYKVGDYVRDGDHFYRVYFPQWQSGIRDYQVHDFVRIGDGTYYKRLPPITWNSATPYTSNAYVSSPSASSYFYKLTSDTCLAPSLYVSATWPSTPTSGSIVSELRLVPPLIFCAYTWTEDTAGYNDLPSTDSPTCTGTCSDRFLWQQLTPSLTTGLGSLTFPTTKGIEFNDGEVRWKESTVYKQAKVYVRPPGCSGPSCEYVLTSLIAERDYVYRP
jgi:hypothetical protein